MARFMELELDIPARVGEPLIFVCIDTFTGRVVEIREHFGCRLYSAPERK